MIRLGDLCLAVDSEADDNANQTFMDLEYIYNNRQECNEASIIGLWADVKLMRAV